MRQFQLGYLHPILFICLLELVDGKEHLDYSLTMDLFPGVAKTYTKYRREYPEETIRTIAEKLHLAGNERLLDIGCGDGRSTFPFVKYFNEIVAVDASGDMIKEAKKRAGDLGVSNVTWIVSRAEDLDDKLGRFKCVVFAQALHWLDVEKVLSLSHKLLTEDGAVVILSGKSIWTNAPTAWERKIVEVIKKYLGPERRTTEGKFKAPEKSFDVYLREAGFKRIEKFNYFFPSVVKTVDEVIAEQFTTSYAAKSLFVDRLKDFENELRTELLKIQPDNRFMTEHKGLVMIGFKETE